MLASLMIHMTMDPAVSAMLIRDFCATRTAGDQLSNSGQVFETWSKKNRAEKFQNERF